MEQDVKLVAAGIAIRKHKSRALEGVDGDVEIGATDRSCWIVADHLSGINGARRALPVQSEERSGDRHFRSRRLPRLRAVSKEFVSLGRCGCFLAAHQWRQPRFLVARRAAARPYPWRPFARSL